MQTIEALFAAHENIIDVFKILNLTQLLTLAENEVITDGTVSECTLDFLIHALANNTSDEILNIHPLVMQNIIELIP